jgi:hypothetical protein
MLVSTATAFLTFARNCVIKKMDGLSEEQLRRAMVDTGTSLLGLVWHLIDAERCWFGYHLAGRGLDDYEFRMTGPPGDSDAAIVGGADAGSRVTARRTTHNQNQA